MKIHRFARAAAAVAGLSTALTAQALVTVDVTVPPNVSIAAIDYDASTLFGPAGAALYLGGDRYGVSWRLPDNLRVAGGTAVFTLPDVIVTGRAGWALSGAQAFLGNIVFSEAGAGTTTAQLTGTLRIDGGGPVSVAASMDRAVLATSPGSTLGYFSETVAFPASFSSISFSGVELTLTAQLGSVVKNIPSPSQQQNELRLSFAAVPVPEPDTYLMLIAGLAAVSVALGRRRAAR